ncbi:MAG: cadherin repeat domain-containing protein, partial [Dehalococcoidia bacterium]|nr:cadherin repeat domain-containing protein [Dehalococcoidia bacterium]
SSPGTVTSANQQVIYAADPHQFGEGHGNYGFRVTTEDGSKSREATITVNVRSVNDPPLDIALTPNSVEEGLDPDSYVGKFTTSDADILDTHTYKFEPGAGDKDNDNFRIVGDSLFTLVEMNFPTKPTHFIRVGSTDDSLAVIEEAMTVLVIGEGMTSPSVFPDQKFTLSEYSAIGTKVGEIEGDDIDIGDILQDWTIVSGDDKGHFTLNDSTGTLTTAAILNFEDTPSYTLGVTTSDSIYTSPVENIVVQVTDVEEGIIVNRTTGLITSEHEESDTFTVVLESAPLEDVIIPLSSSDISEVSISPDSLIFTSSDWSKPKTVKLTGIDDSDTTDGNIPYSVILASTISSDPNYNGIDLPDVAATNIAKDIQGPKVTIQPFDPGYATVNIPVTINASITDVNEISSAILFYFTGGNTKTGIIVMNVTDVGQYEATIPADAITPMGIHFNIFSVDLKGNQSISNYSIEINFPEGKLSTDITGSVLKDGLPKNKWRLISVPARLDDNNVVAVLGDALGKKKSTTWDVRQLNAEDWDAPTEESTKLEPGKGYWLIHDVKTEFPFTTGSGYSLDQTKFEFKLQPLWNIIGNPYPFRVKIEVDETNFYGPLTYGWTGEGWSSPATELQPWSGYVI